MEVILVWFCWYMHFNKRCIRLQPHVHKSEINLSIIFSRLLSSDGSTEAWLVNKVPISTGLFRLFSFSFPITNFSYVLLGSNHFIYSRGACENTGPVGAYIFGRHCLGPGGIIICLWSPCDALFYYKAILVWWVGQCACVYVAPVRPTRSGQRAFSRKRSRWQRREREMHEIWGLVFWQIYFQGVLKINKHDRCFLPSDRERPVVLLACVRLMQLSVRPYGTIERL
jgi:hypothetical protein